MGGREDIVKSTRQSSLFRELLFVAYIYIALYFPQKSLQISLIVLHVSK